ncbi:MAG TPA: hypoxanthine phosphoribosyltransferase [Actinomycetota bacterium]|nr:hypoxanthine phosphoribosyltransferase [Actinomycetota bacterium]
MPVPLAESLISRRELAARATELGAEISAYYSDSVPILVSVLKGSALFLADLVRAISRPVEIDFMSISSYQSGSAQSGVVKIVKDLDLDISGREVLVVEDIVDTGLTLNYLRRTLEERGPASLRAVTLLDKSARRIVPVPLEWRGFEIPDVFVVGYGLDFQGRYRNVPELLAVKDLARLANEPLLLVGSLFGDG